jgi:hypothetical protein
LHHSRIEEKGRVMRVMSPFVSGSNPTLGLNNELHSTEFQEKRGVLQEIVEMSPLD